MPEESPPLPPVSPENIARAPIPVPGTETDAQRERDALAHERAVFERELGVVGRLFGGKQEKSGNIAVFVIVLCFLLIIFAYVAQIWISIPPKGIPATAVVKIDPPLSFERIFTVLASIITLILGYLFGSTEGGRK